MSDDIKQLRVLIDTYKLSRPVSPELQQYVIDSREPDLRHILKKTGTYTLLAWLVIMIFSLLRKYGLHVTLIQSKIIAGITAAAIASGSAAAVYGGARYIIQATGRPASQVEETVTDPETDIQNNIETPPVLPEVQKRPEKEQTNPVHKEKATPSGKKHPIKDKQGPDKKKKDAEEDTVSDIPTL